MTAQPQLVADASERANGQLVTLHGRNYVLEHAAKVLGGSLRPANFGLALPRSGRTAVPRPPPVWFGLFVDV